MCPNGECGRMTQRSQEDDWVERVVRATDLVIIALYFVVPLVFMVKLVWASWP
jgi:hypothetical protein